MAKEFKNNPVTYLKVNRDGLLYTSSSTPKEGYEKIEMKDGKVTYHKTFGSTEDGRLSYIGVNEKTFPTGKVTQLELSIEGEDSTDRLSFNLFKQSGNLNDYVKNLATLLPNLDFSRKINIVPSRKKNANNYVDKSLFINYSGEKGEDSFVKFAHKFGKDGDIPSPEKTTSLQGNVVNDFTKQDKYLYDILLKQIERFKAFKSSNTTEASNVGTTPNTSEPTSSGNSTQNTPDLSNEEHDDLPF